MRTRDRPPGELLAVWGDGRGTWGHGAEVRALAVSADGRLVASASSANRTIRVWSPSSAPLVCALEGEARGHEALAFAPDGRTLYAASLGADARLTSWSLADAQETTPRALPLGATRRLQVSADGASAVLCLLIFCASLFPLVALAGGRWTPGWLRALAQR